MLVPGRKSKSDSNRYIGRPIAGQNRRSYFVSPYVGKQALSINLKKEEGRRLLQRLMKELQVDVFCTNTLPARYKRLGIDYASRPEDFVRHYVCGRGDELTLL